MKRHRMRPVWISIIVMVISYLSISRAEAPESFEKAFTSAVQTFETVAKDGHLTAQSLSPYDDVGAELASKFPTADMVFLRAQAANEKDKSARRLAWAILAKLSDRKEARDLVTEQAVAGEAMAILAISLMPEAARREVTESVITQAKTWQSKTNMIELLGDVGDDKSLKLLSKLAKDSRNESVRKAAAESSVCLQEKLKQEAKGQSLWAQCGATCWRVVREIQRPRVLHLEHEWAVAQIAKSGVKCPVPFLRCHIESGDAIAIMLAGRQKESALVDEIGAAAESNDILQRGSAIGSLIQIGNKDSMDVLFSKMKPEAAKENARIARLLMDYGTSASIDMLERLAEDEKYKNSWAKFKEAIKSINERLEREKTQAKSVPSPTTQSQPAKESQ